MAIAEKIILKDKRNRVEGLHPFLLIQVRTEVVTHVIEMEVTVIERLNLRSSLDLGITILLFLLHLV